ncbi:hypothetical protein E4T56_gene8711 [Termitomyces sp. T112]|nr:hypothetical protein E4T56_gene8711 [Termitomyces sp. T112]
MLQRLQKHEKQLYSMTETKDKSDVYTLCLRHGPVALASSQTQPHFVRSLYFKLNAKSQTQPHFIWSLYFKLNANSQTQPHFVWLGPCISNLMLHPRPNLTSFG